LVFVEYVSALGLGGLVLEGCISDFGNVCACNIDLGAGGDGIHLVHTLERHAVDLEGSADEEETRSELFEENNSVTAISA